MQDQLLVNEEPTTHDSMFYDKLRELGLEHIEELASAIWNEYNASDPGITILEVLSYAIADLSYRTSFEMKDIIRTYKGDLATEKDFYLPNQILPNHAWTVRDLRKVLLDKPQFEPQPDASVLELRNAWPIVSKRSEENLYFNNDEKKLWLESQVLASIETGEDSFDSTAIEQIILNGLYQIQLEFEPNPEESAEHLKDLNYNYFNHCFDYNGNNYCTTILMPYWDDIPWDFRNIDLNTSTLALASLTRQHIIAVDKMQFDEYFYDYFAEFEITDMFATVFPVALNVHLDDFLKTTVTIGLDTFDVQVQFIDWHEVANRIDWDYFNLVDPNHIIQLVATPIIGATNYPVDISPTTAELTLEVALEFTMKPTLAGNTETMMARVTFLNPGDIAGLRTNLTAVKTAVTDGFVLGAAPSLGPFILDYIGLEAELETTLKDLTSQFWTDYLEKIDLVHDRVYGNLGTGHQNIHSYLAPHRNVCEDFFTYTTARVQEIAVFGNIVVEPGHNPNKIIAEMYFLIDQFLSPIITYRTLQDLKNGGYKYADSFNGPTLQHGFLIDEELDALRKRNTIYTSDLINFMMEVEGVIAIQGFNLSNYIDNRLLACNVINCLSLTDPDVYRPKLSRPKSELTATVETLVFDLDLEVITNWFDGWVREKIAGQIPTNLNYDLSIPLGDDMLIEEYYSVQNDLPELYGVGPYGLPIDSTDERRGQAKQLKGYLMFFDQVLANYLQQVSSLRDLFSINRSVESTYAIQPVYDVPDIAPLFKHFNESGQTWEAFKADVNNAYLLQLDDAVEDEATFLDRRNRFLDHLIGRFSESFNEYSAAMYHRIQDELNAASSSEIDIQTAFANYEIDRRLVAAQLIEDKICFLEDYPAISNERSKAINYLEDPFWGQWDPNNPTTTPLNVSGYKKRLCRLLGIKDYSHHNIFDPATFTGAETGDEGGEEGMHIVEHILLRPLSDDDTLLAINSLTFYDSEKDPYSFRVTIVLPNFVGRFVDEPYRIFVERLIRTETPAHIGVDIYWMDQDCGMDFELKFHNWLEAHSVQPWPSFDANYLAVKKELVEEISLPCGQPIELSLVACDDQSIQFIPDTNNRITYFYLATDVYALKFLPPCGIAYIYDLAGGIETLIDTIDPAVYLHEINVGFAVLYGGPGNYLVRYSLGGSIAELFIDVELFTGTIGIQIYDNGIKVAAAETGECLQIDACRVDDYEVDFTPDGGEATIQQIDGVTDPVVVVIDPASEYGLTDLLNDYGLGEYSFTYDHMGQTETTCIELIGPRIRVADDNGNEIFPDASGVIALTSTATSPTDIYVYFQIPGGTWTREIQTGVGYSVDATGTASPDHLHLTTDVVYRYTYELCGLTTQIAICYDLVTDDVDIELYEGDLVFPPNGPGGLYILDPFQQTKLYVGFDPTGGYGEVRFTRNGVNYTAYGGVQNNPRIPFNLPVIWTQHGPGPYLVHYEINPSDELSVFLVDPMIRMFTKRGIELVRIDNAGEEEIHFYVGDRNAYPTFVGPESSVIEIEGVPAQARFNFTPASYAPGRYKMTADHALYDIHDTVYLVIGDVPTGPDATFTCTETTSSADGCTFELKAVDRDATQYEWMIDGVVVSNEMDYTPTLAGSKGGRSYKVTLSVTEGDITNTTTKVIVCDPFSTKPNADFKAIQASNTGGISEVDLTARNRTADSYSYTIDGVEVGDEMDSRISLDFNVEETYTVKLTVETGGIQASTEQVVTCTVEADVNSDYTYTESINRDRHKSDFRFSAIQQNCKEYLWTINGETYAEVKDMEATLDNSIAGISYDVSLKVTVHGISTTTVKAVVATADGDLLNPGFTVEQTDSSPDVGTATFVFNAIDTSVETYTWKIDGEQMGNEPFLNTVLTFSPSKISYKVELQVRDDGQQLSSDQVVLAEFQATAPSSAFISYERSASPTGLCVFDFAPENVVSDAVYSWTVDGTEMGTSTNLFGVELMYSEMKPEIVVRLTATKDDLTSFTEELLICDYELTEEDAEYTVQLLSSTLIDVYTFDFIAELETADKYEWSIDGDVIGTDKHLLRYALNFAKVESYPLTLTVTVDGVSATITKDITAENEGGEEDEGPTADFTVNHLAGTCNFDFIAVDNDADGYHWTINQLYAGSAEHILGCQLDLSAETPYVVELQVTNDDVTVSYQKEVWCDGGAAPDPRFTWELIDFSETGICTMLFTAVEAAADSYSWFADGREVVTLVNIHKRSFDFSHAKSYLMTLKVSANGVSAKSTETVTCDPMSGKPNSGFTVEEMANDGAGNCTFNFTASDANNDTYQWYIDDVELSTEIDVVGTVVNFIDSADIKTVKLAVTKNALNASDTQEITCVVKPPKLDATFNAVLGISTEVGYCNFSFVPNDLTHESYEWLVDGQRFFTKSPTLVISLDYRKIVSHRIQLNVVSAGLLGSSAQDVGCEPAPTTASDFTVTELKASDNGVCVFDFKAATRDALSYQWRIDALLVADTADMLERHLDFSIPNTVYVVELFVSTDSAYATRTVKEVSCTYQTLPNSDFEIVDLGPGGAEGCGFTFVALERTADAYSWHVDGIEVETRADYDTILFAKDDGSAYTIELTVELGGTKSSTAKQIICGSTLHSAPRIARAQYESQIEPSVEELAPETGAYGTFSILDATVSGAVYSVNYVSNDGTDTGESYRWEVDGAYRAQSESPTMTFDFGAASSYVVTLITTIDGVEYTVSETLTQAIADLYVD